ncbi:MAG TPA: proprotein convertase P-domain-containing protein [Herpetosiphonaceae bacterium]
MRHADKPARWMFAFAQFAAAFCAGLLALLSVRVALGQEPANPYKKAYVEPPPEAVTPVPAPPAAAGSILVAAPPLPATIPDNAYIGTLDGNDAFGVDAGMACLDINTTGLVPSASTIAQASAVITATHTWIGDLTLKLRSPSGQIVTILNRPGSTAPDDGADSPVGDSSNWNGRGIAIGDGFGPEAETMGAGITDGQNICQDNGVCAHDPSPDTAAQPPAALSAVRNSAASGVWTMCAGDSGDLDTGNFTWALVLIPQDGYTSGVSGSIPDDGYVGGFGGAGMRCSTINTTSPAPGNTTVLGASVRVNLTHTWVGDLTMKLRSPSGTTLTFLNRPGSTAADDGGGAIGNSANWSGALDFGDGFGPEAETMGNGLTTDQIVCTANGVCSFDPSPDTAAQPPAAFSAFNGQPAAGTWTLCVGDSALGDTGTLNSWTLYLRRAQLMVPSAVTLSSLTFETSQASPGPVALPLGLLLAGLGAHAWRRRAAKR